MELNDPKQLIELIDKMLWAMDKKLRVQFLKWVKAKKNRYDLDFPLGGKNATQSVSANVIPDPVISDVPVEQKSTEPSVESVTEVSDNQRPIA